MYKKILFATDLSDASNGALMHIKTLKQAKADEIVILHVLTEDSSLYLLEGFSKKYVEKFDRDFRNIVLKEIRPIVCSLTHAGYKVKVTVVKGIPFKEILRIADEEDVSLIILGDHANRIKKLLPWSTSRIVVRKSKRPVLVIEKQYDELINR